MRGESSAEGGRAVHFEPLPRDRFRVPPASHRLPVPVDRRASALDSPSPPPVPARPPRRRVLFENAPAAAAEAVHTVHVQVPVGVAVDPSSINMSLRVNISTSSTPSSSSAVSSVANGNGISHNGANKSAAETAGSSASSSSAVVVPAPIPAAAAAGLSSPRVSSARKRKSYAKKNTSSRDKDSFENQPSSAQMSSGAVVSVSSSAVISSGAGASSRSKSPFEKLNTLKMLLDCGHLTPEEYQERKTQIINEMTGTSTERKKPSPRRVLQPIMKTVVPHNPPDFTRIPKERAEKLSFDVDTLEWQATSTRVKLDLVPFATGQLRNAYFLQEYRDGEPKLFVAKLSIRQADPSSYLSDVEMQAVCAHYAALYNEHEPPLKVYYAESWLLKLKDRGDMVCSVEEYLPGAYVKYSNNNGYVGKETSTTEERERNTPHAFSHFTFVASDYRLMVVDIQGVDDSYTDPQIHTADGRGFGAGNLGTFGMEKFLETHRCNEVCRWLGLKSINKEYKPGGTAAPEYQMPFGGKIKKSTSRITEERNTFSRSVTVSEAFGGSDMLQAALDDDVMSVSTTATGSSSLLYGQQLPQHYMSPMEAKLPLESRPSHRLSSPPRRGRHLRGPEFGDEPSPFWLAIRRLLCCCGAW